MRRTVDRRMLSVALGTFALAAFVACGRERPAAPPVADGHPPPTPAERFHYGTHSRPITTTTAAAQQAFDHGLTLAFAFSYGAAEKEFRRAAELDPQSAMAWWGVALVNGPHINFPLVLPDKAKAAWEALGRARSLASTASPVEQALITALATRHADPQPEDRAPLEQAYAAAMRDVWKAYPADADVATLYAESLMNLRPWDLWKPDGSPQPGTEEILATLERAQQLAPQHPGAHHYYIHAVESSRTPERALASADRLGDLVPGSGHLVHMPSHIYARVGRWADAAAMNVRAIETDDYYRTQHSKPGFYALYMLHNHHFLAFTAMMRGRSEEALVASRSLVAGVPADFLADFTTIADGFMIFPSAVLLRFGRWDEILAEPEPSESLPLSRALWRFTRAAARNAKGEVAEADKERDAFRAAAAKVPAEWVLGNAPASAILAIAAHVLDGEIDAKAGRLDAAVATLREAVRLEDDLRYDEPPDWIQPVRHTLGAVLLRAKRPAEAEAVYRDDLLRWPENGWALLGLAQALHAQEEHAEAAETEQRATKAWADADVKPTLTCLCLPGA